MVTMVGCVFLLRHPGGAAEAHPDDIAAGPTFTPPPEHHYQVPPASGHSSAPRCPGSVQTRRRQTNQPFEKCLSLLFSSCCVPARLHGNGPRRGDHMTWVRDRHWLNSDQGGGGSEDCAFFCKYPAAVLAETPPLQVLSALRFHGDTKGETRQTVQSCPVG